MPQVGRGWRRGRRGPRRRAGRRAGGRRGGCRGVGEEVGPHVGGGLAGQLGEVLGEFLFGVAPGEVGVGLLEADRREGVHHRGAGEGLGEEDHVGVGAVDVRDDLLPEHDGFGVRVVDAEDAHAVGHPVAQDPAGLGDQAVHVGVEGDGVDVLVLLRGFSAWAMVPSGRWWNQSGCLSTQGWSGEHWRAKSRAISRPWAWAWATNQSKSSRVPRSGGRRRGRLRGSRWPRGRRRRRGRR